MIKDSHMIIRADGKVYFGEVVEPTVGQIGDMLVCMTIKNAVEIMTTMTTTPTGIQKRVIVVSIDYSSKVLPELHILSPGVAYKLNTIPPKDAEALMEDYNRMISKDNLVKLPPKKSLV
jgi:hypothetical protein